jgi:hypothetical protein
MFERLWYKIKRWFIARSVNNSSEPMLRIVSEGIDPTNNGVHLDLLWNDKFIEHIKSHGFVGNTDEECVQFYIASLVHSRHVEESQPIDHVSMR